MAQWSYHFGVLEAVREIPDEPDYLNQTAGLPGRILQPVAVPKEARTAAASLGKAGYASKM